jgi:outer membrane lipoprotein-sorting protein
MKSQRLNFIRSAALLALLLLSVSTSYAQNNARNILDKCASTLNGNGITASFAVNVFNGSKLQGGTSGSISIKGSKFHAYTPQNIVWFDGKTEWTYVKKNDEVNVNNPTDAQLQSMNPYRFINLYRSGYNLSVKSKKSAYAVHLKSQNKKSEIQEVYIMVNKSNYQPMNVRMRKGANQWYSISISNIRNKTLSDNIFRFNQKDFPKAEVIDLR